MKIVVTGNIGCGKSTLVRKLLEKLPDYQHFDFDKAVHQLYGNAEYLAEVKAAFGTTERAALSDLVFGDEVKKRDLEQISVKYLTGALTEALQSKDIIVEFPLLCEIGWHIGEFDTVIVATCNEVLQLERIKMRDGFSEAKIEAIRGSQASAQLKCAFADIVFDTGLTQEAQDEAISNIIDDVVRRDFFSSSLERRCLSEFGSPAIWEEISFAYTQHPRKYHTLEHLEAMFAHYDSLPTLENATAVRWAIWFHDFVYKTDEAYSNNESASASEMFRLIRKHARHLLGKVEAGNVCMTLAGELILATKSHKPPTFYFGTRKAALEDCKRFLDIDLAILGKSEEVVKVFDDNIRQEFMRYSDSDFSQGRVAALTSFLERETIYYSKEFANLEQPARENLRKIIAHWKGI